MKSKRIILNRATKLINASNYREASINDWQKFFNIIFSKRNKEYDHPSMWNKVVEHSTQLAEAIRKREFFEASTSISRIFCWVCGFVSSNPDIVENSSLEDIIWFKYPRVCNYCVPEISQQVQRLIDVRGGILCQCGREVGLQSNKKVRASLLKQYYKNPRPKTLDEWGSMFDAIYGDKISLMSLDDICFHLLEEVGEVLVALRKKADFVTNIPAERFTVGLVKKTFGNSKSFETVLNNPRSTYQDFLKALNQNVREEVADVVSWLFSLIGKLVDLRNNLSNYEVKAYERLLKQDARLALNDQGLIMQPPKQSSLKLSSILFLWYNNGCTICENLTKNKENCQCTNSIPRNFIR